MAASSSRDAGVSIEEYDELKGKFEDLQIESHKLRGQLKAKEGQLSLAEADNRDLNKIIKKLEKDGPRHKGAVESQRDEIRRLGAQVGMLQEKVREYEERTSALEREVQERRADESDMHTVVQAMGRMKRIIEKRARFLAADVEYHMEVMGAMGEEGGETVTFLSHLYEELASYGNMPGTGVKISEL